MRFIRPGVVLLAAGLLTAPAAAAAGMRRPAGLAATALSDREVVLTWTDTNRAEVGYAVERRRLPRGRYLQAGMTAPDETTYRDGGLAAGTHYRYRVRTVGPRRMSMASQAATVVTLVTPTDLQPPQAPTNVTATAVACDRIALGWEPVADVGDAGLKGYNVYRDGMLAQHVPALATSTTEEGLAPLTPYAYTVTAVDNAGNESTPSAPARATTPLCSTTTSSSTTSTTSSTVASNQRPVAAAGPDQLAQTLTALTFSGAGSRDPDGRIVGYAWSFGDGGTASGSSVSHAYAAAGTYAVTLTVTDERGISDGDTATARISNRPPVASAGPDQAAVAGASLAFSGAGSSDLDGRIVDYAWAFGDGTAASGIGASHGYATVGSYTVTLTVTDDQGAVASDTALVTVSASGGGALTWARRFGNTGFDEVRAVLMDGSGNLVVTGQLTDSVDLGGITCTGSIFLAKYTAGGNLVWAHCPTGGGGGSSRAIAVDASGNLFVTGYFRGSVDFGGGPLSSPDGYDAFLAKYAADGAHLWSRRFGSPRATALPSEFGSALVVDAAGTVFVTGVFEGTADFGGGPLTSAGQGDGFLARYSSAGAHLWSRRFGGVWNDSSNALAVDPGGDVIVTGTFLGSVDFGGAVLASSGFDVFLAKYSPAGAHLWSRRFGGTLQDAGTAVALDASGNVVLAGTFEGTIDVGGGPLTAAGGTDVFLAQYSPAGAHRWSRRIGGTSNYDGGTGLAVDATGNAVLAGYFSRTVDFGTGALTSGGSKDVFVAKYGPGGAALWARRYGGTSIDAATAVVVEPGGSAVVSGSFFGTIDFGAGPLVSAGEADLFLLRLTP